MYHDYDVLVLGGGIAGAAAALAAAQQDARVCLVRAGPAVTALSIGAWRGPTPAGLRDALARAGLPLERCAPALPRPDGTLLQADEAPHTHARAALSGARTLVCGFAGLSDFHAVALAALWRDAARDSATDLLPVTLTLAGTPAAGWSPTSLAALLEHEPTLLGEPLARVVREHAAARVIVPAVLGVEFHANVHARIEAHARVPVGEALGGTPSLPGWRLDVALRAALRDANIDVVIGRVMARQATAQQLDSVTVTSDAGERTLRAPCVVLATGKFVGGGIIAEPHLRESALGCDVVLQRFDRVFDTALESLLLTSELRADAQPLLGVGVRADDEARPLNAFGDVAYRNVFVAGSVRADVETTQLGLGAAAADGWNAGARAATYARLAA